MVTKTNGWGWTSPSSLPSSCTGLRRLVWLLCTQLLKLNFPCRTGLHLLTSGWGVRVAQSLKCKLVKDFRRHFTEEQKGEEAFTCLPHLISLYNVDKYTQ